MKGVEEQKYRYLDHTSDLGIEVFGADLPGLFANACFAVFDNILDLDPVRPAETRRIELQSATIEELLLDWLRELLFRFATEYFVVKEVGPITIDGTHLRVEVRGEKFSPERHRVKIEIKTPTYHMFSITRQDSGYKASIIFDV